MFQICLRSKHFVAPGSHHNHPWLKVIFLSFKKLLSFKVPFSFFFLDILLKLRQSKHDQNTKGSVEIKAS